VHEGPRAVDGIEDPADAGARVRLAVLLTEDGVVRVALLDPGPNQLLGLPVRDGDGGAVALVVGGYEPAVVLEREVSGLER
jgi:hypothetical protein